MLTDQERQALDASVDTAIETANRMKSIITNVSAKRNVVEKKNYCAKIRRRI